MLRKRFTKREIESLTQRILKEHNCEGIIPVPVDTLIEKLGVDIVPKRDMLKRIGIDAFWDQNFTQLYIDEERYMSTYNHRGRFTLAHEMGHYYLHKKDRKVFKDINEWKEHILGKTHLRRIEELEANDFAGFLLIPTKSLSTKLNKLKTTDEFYVSIIDKNISDLEVMRYFSSDLARYFEVSTHCIEIRIKYFNDNF